MLIEKRPALFCVTREAQVVDLLPARAPDRLFTLHLDHLLPSGSHRIMAGGTVQTLLQDGMMRDLAKVRPLRRVTLQAQFDHRLAQHRRVLRGLVREMTLVAPQFTPAMLRAPPQIGPNPVLMAAQTDLDGLGRAQFVRVNNGRVRLRRLPVAAPGTMTGLAAALVRGALRPLERAAVAQLQPGFSGLVMAGQTGFRTHVLRRFLLFVSLFLSPG
jgi:hypothetical protein